MSRFWDPLNWSWGHYALVAVILLLINALGPKGLVPWVLLSNEQGRIAKDSERARDEITRLQSDMKRFASSEKIRSRMIREDLGALQSSEISIEFLPSQPVR
jgi:hypothetical protein